MPLNQPSNLLTMIEEFNFPQEIYLEEALLD